MTKTSVAAKLRQAARRRSIEGNLFPAALPALDSNFRWHTAEDGIDSYKEHSSQALAIDVFGTLKASSTRDQVLEHWAGSLDLPTAGPWQVELEWHDPDNLLHERQPSWIDAIARSPGALIFFEVKFTEADGGRCSQTLPIQRGRNRGLTQCNGAYMQQVNPATGREAFCALSAKRIRYWELVPQVFNFPADLGYLPCPFAGPRFQWMRNLTICWAVAQHHQLQPAFVLAYADGPTLPMAARVRSDDWTKFTDTLNPQSVPVQTRSLQWLLALARAAALDDPTWPELSDWVNRKIDSVCRARQVHASDSPP